MIHLATLKQRFTMCFDMEAKGKHENKDKIIQVETNETLRFSVSCFLRTEISSDSECCAKWIPKFFNFLG